MGNGEVFRSWSYSTSDRPCTYCDKSWRQLRTKYNGTVYYQSPNGFMTKIGQTNAATKRTIWSWCCPSCKELLEKEIAKPVSDYLTDPEQIAAATIRLVTTAVSKEQKQQEVLAT